MRHLLGLLALVLSLAGCSQIAPGAASVISVACAVFDAVVDVTREDADAIDAAVAGDASIGQKICQVFASAERVLSDEPQEVSVVLPDGTSVTGTIRPRESLATE